MRATPAGSAAQRFPRARDKPGACLARAARVARFTPLTAPRAHPADAPPRSKLTLDFDTNKRVTDEVAICPSKRMRNKIAGFMTHLMRRIERGDQVRGISLKLQEEERERRMDFVPEVSAINTDAITVDPETKALLDTLALPFAAGVTVQQPQRTDFKPRREGPVGGAPRS